MDDKVHIKLISHTGHCTIFELGHGGSMLQFLRNLFRLLIKINLFALIMGGASVLIIKEGSAAVQQNPLDEPHILKRMLENHFDSIDLKILRNLHEKKTIGEVADDVYLSGDAVHKRLQNMYSAFLTDTENRHNARKKYKLVIRKLLA